MGPLASPPSPTRSLEVGQKSLFLVSVIHLDRRRSRLSHTSSKSFVDDLCAVVSPPCSFLLPLSFPLSKKRGRRGKENNKPTLLCPPAPYRCLNLRIWHYSPSPRSVAFNLRTTCRPAASGSGTSGCQSGQHLAPELPHHLPYS